MYGKRDFGLLVCSSKARCVGETPHDAFLFSHGNGRGLRPPAYPPVRTVHKGTVCLSKKKRLLIRTAKNIDQEMQQKSGWAGISFLKKIHVTRRGRPL